MFQVHLAQYVHSVIVSDQVGIHRNMVCIIALIPKLPKGSSFGLRSHCLVDNHTWQHSLHFPCTAQDIVELGKHMADNSRSN